MSALANPYHNAQAESFMKTLKVEEIYPSGYETFAEVAERLPLFIDNIYKARPLHSALGYRSPDDSKPNSLRGWLTLKPSPVQPEGFTPKVGQVHPAVDTATGIPPVGPLFATIGAAILNALCADMVSRLGAAGIAAPVYVSGNIPGAGPHNAVLVDRYASRNTQF